MPLDGAFTVLLLIICGVCSTKVPPPFSVTVSCQNENIAVRWSQRQPETIFLVRVTGYDTVENFTTTDLQYDLSDFVWGSEERFLKYMSVEVTAIQGGNQSKAVESFSFNRLLAVDKKCELDFPPVTLHPADGFTSVEFQNPFRYYKKLKNNCCKNPPVLRYDVSDKGNFDESCIGKDIDCKSRKIPNKSCITLNGLLIFGDLGTEQVEFRTNKSCHLTKVSRSNDVHGSDDVHGAVVFAAVLGSIFIVVAIVAVVFICRVKAWTMETPVPFFKHTIDVFENQQFFQTPKDPKISPVSTFEPCDRSSIKSDGDNCSEHLQGNGSDCTHHASATGSLKDYLNSPHQEEEGLMSATDADSVKTECVSIGTPDAEPSPYDRPHLVMMDMGDGDLVTGYSTK